MTKVKQKDATRELNVEAAKVRDEATRVRKDADNLVRALREKESAFLKEREDQATKARNEERQKKLSDHSKAYVMLDADEQAQLDAARAKARRSPRRPRPPRQSP